MCSRTKDLSGICKRPTDPRYRHSVRRRDLGTSVQQISSEDQFMLLSIPSKVLERRRELGPKAKGRLDGEHDRAG